MKRFLKKSIDKTVGQANGLYFFAELVDLDIFSKVGYVPSRLAVQMVDDDWATQRPLIPMCTELTVIAEEGDVAGTKTAVTIDWNAVELDEATDFFHYTNA